LADRRQGRQVPTAAPARLRLTLVSARPTTTATRREAGSSPADAAPSASEGTAAENRPVAGHRLAGRYRNLSQSLALRQRTPTTGAADRSRWPACAIVIARLRPTGMAGGDSREQGNFVMHSIIYLVGLIVVVLAILSFVGLA
jgi:hypothetical protein